ncbi:sperm motility kinase 2B-like [Sciurus carolinensis]|uniref:sperm motility kinase 2B-like n=1 Tax=Sciurus carolinensis TaxID=30640 RepID=UPI001FB32F86|nr:sperm motility kinase 2B-like [Sciurus carolinensis]
MEYASGGQLFEHVPPGGMQEEEARRFFYQVTCAVAYCHDMGIVHRDLKSENFMVDARGNVKMIDFGLSTSITSEKNFHEFWGTLSHLAPEMVLSQAYEGPPVDIWSLGIILYFLLTRSRPFMAPTTHELLKLIVLGSYNIPHHVPLQARKLIQEILTLNPKERPTAKKILEHPWLTQGEQYLPPHGTKSLIKRPDPEIMTIIFDKGYDIYKTWVSLANRKFNAAMATYLILEHQKSHGESCTLQGKPVPPRVKPHPLGMDTPPRRSSSEPNLRTFPLPSQNQLPKEAKEAEQKVTRSASLPAIPLQFLTTPDIASRPDSEQPHAKKQRWKQVIRRMATCFQKLFCCISCVNNKLAPM